MFRDGDGTAKAAPLVNFLEKHHLENLHPPTPLDCLALKERLGIANDRWK